MAEIKTRFLILSDTHAIKSISAPDVPVDVAIHCGDLTEESKLDEFRTTLSLLRTINAPLKLVIAGNHDFTLDTPTFETKAAYSREKLGISPSLIAKEYGHPGSAQQLFTLAAQQQQDNIVFLDEGIHHFSLHNGAKLTVYASPFTSSLEADWGFQFKRGESHSFAMDNTVDVAITHSPPKGILDNIRGSKHRGGCEHLFAAVAAARPRLHCFGHIHEGWGAKLVTWRGETASENPSHFTDIDNGASVVVESLATLRPGKWEAPEMIREKEARVRGLMADGYRRTSHVGGSSDEHPIERGRQTLFVNAAIEPVDGEEETQLPWVVDLALPADIVTGD